MLARSESARTRERRQRHEAEVDVLDSVFKGGPCSAAWLVEETGRELLEVAQTLSRLHRRGDVLATVDGWVYVPTPRRAAARERPSDRGTGRYPRSLTVRPLVAAVRQVFSTSGRLARSRDLVPYLGELTPKQRYHAAGYAAAAGYICRPTDGHGWAVTEAGERYLETPERPLAPMGQALGALVVVAVEHLAAAAGVSHVWAWHWLAGQIAAGAVELLGVVGRSKVYRLVGDVEPGRRGGPRKEAR